MKIIILGGGQVGLSVAENLVTEDNDITIVDTDANRLQEIQDRLDLRTVVGYASHPEALRQAGADDADMILAVTGSDEANMTACQIAYSLFHTPTKIARIRSAAFLSHPEIFAQEAIPVDVIISPEQIVASHIQRLIEYPSALQVLDFADGLVELVAVKAFYGGPMVGHELRTMRDHLPGIEARVAAIYRGDRPIVPDGDTVIEPDDEVFFLAARKHIRAVMSEMRKLDKRVKRIMIAGAGNIGRRLASSLERGNYLTKIIELDAAHARSVAEELNKTIVLLGNAADEDLLLREGVEDTDIFCAITNDDEANILSAMLAKRLGARKVMSLIKSPAYVDLVESGANIDIAVSPQQAVIGSLLAHVRRGDVVAVHSLRRGAAEAIEAIAHGDTSSSRVVGHAIGDIKLPRGTTIGALVRKKKVIICHHDTVIEPNDHVIMFLIDKKHISQVERLFQVDYRFV